jgi:serine/threonine protein kinase
MAPEQTADTPLLEHGGVSERDITQQHCNRSSSISSTTSATMQTPNVTPSKQPSSACASRQTAWWQASVVRRSSSAVDEAVDELTEKSQFLLRRSSPRNSTVSASSTESSTSISTLPTACPTSNSNPKWLALPTPIAKFHRHEILVGQLLGEGTFSCVYEVTGFDLSRDDDDEHHLFDESDHDVYDDNRRLRQDVAAATLTTLTPTSATSTTTTTSFALKHLKPDLLTCSKDFEQAATDLVMEAKYLSALNHRNILKLRGWAFGGTAAFETGHHDGYFLLTDKLVETLAQRIDRWKDYPEQQASVACKTRYAMQIADAVAYLHERRIICRDLKPSNLGFTQEDQIQLFDFGLCRELPPPSRARPYYYCPFISADDDGEERDEYYAPLDESWEDYGEVAMPCEESGGNTKSEYREEVYYMSGAGTQIYMATEILKDQKYNLKADVYSWSMVFYELLTLRKPFPWYTMEEHIQYVCKEGDRPVFLEEDEVPDVLKELLETAWIGDVSRRFSMDQVCHDLSSSILPLIEAEEDRAGEIIMPTSLAQRLSTHIRDAADRVKGFVLNLIQSVLSLFKSRPRRRGASDEDVTLLPPSLEDRLVETTTSSSPVSGEASAPFPYEPEDKAADGDSDVQQDEETGFASPQQQQQEEKHQQNKQQRAMMLLKRKSSSASTTSITDDEYEEDSLTPPTFKHTTATLKSFSSLSVPIMEEIVERQ